MPKNRVLIRRGGAADVMSTGALQGRRHWASASGPMGDEVQSRVAGTRMITTTDILITIFVPMLTALMVGLLFLRVRSMKYLAFSISTAVGFGCGKLALDARDFMAVQPAQQAFATRLESAVMAALKRQSELSQAQDWLVVLGLVLSLILASSVFRNQRRRVAVLATSGLIVALVVVRLLWNSVYFVSRWSFAEAALYVLGIACCMVIPISLFNDDRDTMANENATGDDDPIQIPRRWLLPTLVWLGMLASSLTFMLTGSKSFGELGGVLSFAFLGTFLATLSRRTALMLDDLRIVVVLLGGLMLLACAFSSTAIWQVVMLGFGMTVPSVLLKVTGIRGKLIRWIAIAVFLLTVVPVVGLAGWRFAQATKIDNPYSQYK